MVWFLFPVLLVRKSISKKKNQYPRHFVELVHVKLQDDDIKFNLLLCARSSYDNKNRMYSRKVMELCDVDKKLTKRCFREAMGVVSINTYTVLNVTVSGYST